MPTLKDELALHQPDGGSAWGVVGSFLDGFSSPNPSAEFAFFSVDIRAVAPGRVEFSANAPSFEQGANQGFETLVFPTIPETPKFSVDPADIDFLQTIDSPLVLNIAGPPTADLVGRSADDGTWWVALSDGSSFTNQRWGRWAPTVTWVDVMVADVDGDGKTDIVGRSAADGRWWVAKSTGSSFDNVAWGSWPTDVVWQDVLIGNFSNRVPDAMHGSGLPPADHGPVAELTEADLQWIVDAAIPQLAEAGGWDAYAHPLDSVTFQIADLPSTLLGQTLGTTILIDRDAAGFGWFVDRCQRTTAR